MIATAEPEIARCPTSLIPVEEMSPDDWWVCSIRSGREIFLAEYLTRHRVHFFLPIVRHRRRKTNGQGREYWVESDRPKFPRYMFLNGDESREVAMIHSRRSTDSSCTVWPVSRKAQSSLHDELIQLDRAIKANPYLRTVAGFKAGQRVKICRGPLRGVCGTIEKIDENCIVWLNCQLLGQATPVENVPIEFIEEDWSR